MMSHARSLTGALILTSGFLMGPASAEVRLSEVRIANSPQTAELFNSGPGTIDLTNWVLRNQSGSSITNLSGTIGVNQFRTFSLNGSVQKRGDILELFDPALDNLTDRLRFGDSGGAPIDIDSVATSSISRAAGTADPSGVTSATNWSVDFTATLGSTNDVPLPQFNHEVLINEIIPQGGSVRAELFNSTGQTVNLNGYKLTTGIQQLQLSGLLPAGGFVSFDITALTFEFSLNLYLFRNDEVRIDQLGLSDSPGNQTTWLQAKTVGESIGRCPNGNGSQIGFDLASSGFPFSLRRMTPTVGASNNCSLTSGVPVRWPALAAAALACWALAYAYFR
ncbi:MAG TPA: hypothetical protein VNM87_13790, partial [Candidatus Udaeobacter sp.]|nr:hypothetical protein [Candidatus Udaeobacter sp.]